MRSVVAPLEVVVCVCVNAAVLGGLAGRAAAHEADAAAGAEGQEEDALRDEEAAEHVAIALKRVLQLVHVRLWQRVPHSDLTARLALLVEAENGGEQQAHQVGHLGQLEQRNGQLEELAVDESGEAAHDQPAEDRVDDGVVLEHEPPVRVRVEERLATSPLDNDLSARLRAIIVHQVRAVSSCRSSFDFLRVLQLILGVVVVRAMEQIPIVTGEHGNYDKGHAQQNHRNQLQLTHSLVYTLVILLVVHPLSVSFFILYPFSFKIKLTRRQNPLFNLL